jgi:hypothetical protein
LSKHEWELVDERCRELHEAGLIQPSSSDFAAATVMPAKKDSAGLWTEKRMCADYRPLNLVNKEDWDLALPYIAMGYRMSKHASLFHFFPYFLLFGRHPIPPSSIVAQMDQVVDLDSPTTWAKVIAERATLFRRVMPMAMENLSIAQHRDTLRYAHTQGGSYKPKVKQFDVGDFVYFQRQPNDTLDTSSSCTILRIKEIRPSGLLEL